MKAIWKTAWLALALGAAAVDAAAPAGDGADGSAEAPILEIRRLFAQGRWSEALAAMAQEEARQPGQEDLLFLRAMVAMEWGEHAEALRLYTRLLERYPGNPSLKNNVAWLRVQSHDPAVRDLDLALEEAREAILASPHDYNIWNTLGEIYLARGDATRALRAAVLARDLAMLAGEPDRRLFLDLVRRCEAPRGKERDAASAGGL